MSVDGIYETQDHLGRDVTLRLSKADAEERGAKRVGDIPAIPEDPQEQAQDVRTSARKASNKARKTADAAPAKTAAAPAPTAASTKAAPGAAGDSK
jgi:hypothetical protein